MKKIRERFIAFEKERKLRLLKTDENREVALAEQLDFLCLGDWCSEKLAYICMEKGKVVIFYEITDTYGELCEPDIISGDGRYSCFFINAQKEMVVIENKCDVITQSFIGLDYNVEEDSVSFWTSSSMTTFIK